MKSTQKRIVSILFIAMLLTCFSAPLFSDIRSVQTRDFTADDYTVETTRYAKIEAGTVLNKKMVEATIVNDGTPTFALVLLTIDMLTGDWAGNTVAVYFTEELDGDTDDDPETNEVFRFNNTELKDYLSILEVETLDIDGINITSFDDFLSTGMPDGTYKIILEAFQVDSADATPSGTALESVENEFIVVAIDNLSIDKLPTLANQETAWQLPMIPFYDDESTSTSVVTVKEGSTVLTTTTIHHDVPSGFDDGGADLKGYPDDADNGASINDSGYVTLDLAALPFRLGTEYSLKVTFNDWNNELISEQTGTFSFSATVPTPSLGAPSGVIETLMPDFSWSMPTAYDSWIDHYDLFIGGTRYSGLGDNAFSLSDPLTPGKTYEWYVVPYYSDDTAFFDAVSAPRSSFSTPAHTQLDVSVTEPAVDSGTLFTGTAYPFEAEYTLYDGAEMDEAKWIISGRNLAGSSVSFTPSSTGTVIATYSATDSYNLTKTVRAGSYTVKNPELEIRSGSTRGYVDGLITITAASQHVDRIEWYVDGSMVFDGNATAAGRYSYFIQPGEHVISARGYTSGYDGSWTQTEVETASGEITIEGFDAVSPGEVSFGIDPDRQIFPAGDDIDFDLLAAGTFDIGSGYGIQVAWTLDGSASASVSGDLSSVSYTDPQPGEHILEMELTDSLGAVGTFSIPLVVYGDPVISITSPENGSMLGETGSIPVDADITIPGIANDSRYYDDVVTSVNWYLDDASSPSASGAPASINTDMPGTHTLKVEITLENGESAEDEVEFEIAFDFTMNLESTPRGATEMFNFESIDFRAVIGFLPGSPVSVNDLDEDNFGWYVNNSSEGSGLDYTLEEDQGTYTVYAEYEHNGNSKRTQTRTVTVREPQSPQITSPVDGGTQLIFGPGNSLTLRGSGEPDAIYDWEILAGSRVVMEARGSDVTINTPSLPSGTERVTIRLTTSLDSSWSETVEREFSAISLVPFTVQLNGPTVITVLDTFRAETILSGSQTGVVYQYQYAINGIQQSTDTSSNIFTSPGSALIPGIRYTLGVEVLDNFGRRASASMQFDVINPMSLAIIKTNRGTATYSGQTDVLTAVLRNSGGAPGTYSWLVTQPDGSMETSQGAVLRYTFESTGNYQFDVSFSSNFGEISATPLIVEVRPQPILQLSTSNVRSYYSPGERVPLRAIFSEGFSDDGIVYEWYLNDARLDNTGNTLIHTVGNPGTLEQITCKAMKNGIEFGSAAYSLQVNSPPAGFQVTISPATAQFPNPVTAVCSGAFDPEGHDIQYAWFFRAEGEDPWIQITDWSAESVAEITSPGEGSYEVIARLRDSFGATSESAPVMLNLYPAISHLSPVINNGNPLYLTRNPLPLAITLPEGYFQTEWTITQGDFTQTLTGDFVVFQGGNALVDGQVTIGYRITIGDMMVSQGQNTITAKTIPYAAAITSPENGSQQPGTGSVVIAMTLSGFTDPTFAVLVDDVSSGVAGSAQMLPNESGGYILDYLLTISAETLEATGLHTVKIIIAENGTSVEKVLTIQTVEVQTGMTIVPKAETLDHRIPDAAGWNVSAEIQNIDYDSISWESSRHTDPIGTGASLNLQPILTEPGHYIIYCKLLDATGAVIAVDSFAVTVYTEMRLSSEPDISTGTYSSLSTEGITVTALNRDGSAVDGDSILWRSNLGDFSKTGSLLTPGKDLIPGNNVVTVTATGTGGDTVTRSYTITVVADVPSGQQGPPDDSGGPGSAGDDKKRDAVSLLDMVGQTLRPKLVSILLDYTGSVSIIGDFGSKEASKGMMVYSNESIEIGSSGSATLITLGIGTEIITLEGGETYSWSTDDGSWEEE